MRDDRDVARLLVSCPDRHGIVAAVSAALAEAGANIVNSEQHSTDPEGGSFFLRMEFHLQGLAGRRSRAEASAAYRRRLGPGETVQARAQKDIDQALPRADVGAYSWPQRATCSRCGRPGWARGPQ